MELLQSWARRFNDGMLSEDCYVLALIDNASLTDIASPLPLTLEMLPINTTTYLQPPDAVTFKTQVERLKNRHVVDTFEELLNLVVDDGKKH